MQTINIHDKDNRKRWESLTSFAFSPSFYHEINIFIFECKYMKHIFELQMKDQIEERSSQLLRNLSSCEKKA